MGNATTLVMNADLISSDVEFKAWINSANEVTQGGSKNTGALKALMEDKALKSFSTGGDWTSFQKRASIIVSQQSLSGF